MFGFLWKSRVSYNGKKKSVSSYKTKKFFFRKYEKIIEVCYRIIMFMNEDSLDVLSVEILLIKNAFTYSKMARPKVMKNILSV